VERRQGGVYCQDVEIAEVHQPDSASNDGVSPWAIDPKAAECLWILSEELTGVKFDSEPAASAAMSLTASPYMHPVTTDDLKRYRDAGLEEVGLLNFDIPNTERDLTEKIERMAREFVKPAAKL